MKFLFEGRGIVNGSNGWRNAVPAFCHSADEAGFTLCCAACDAAHVTSGSMSCVVFVVTSNSLLAFLHESTWAFTLYKLVNHVELRQCTTGRLPFLQTEK